MLTWQDMVGCSRPQGMGALKPRHVVVVLQSACTNSQSPAADAAWTCVDGGTSCERHREHRSKLLLLVTPSPSISYGLRWEGVLLRTFQAHLRQLWIQKVPQAFGVRVKHLASPAEQVSAAQTS
jgi:hypothetical protein